MNSLCMFMLLATTLASVIGDPDFEIVNLTCNYENNDIEMCEIVYVDYRLNKPNNLNITDASNDTTEFKMFSGHYTVMPSNLFQLFPKLVEISMFVGLEAITKENLIGGGELQVLNLFRNNIKEIKAHTFDEMDKLEYINLDMNKLTKIESDAFAGAISLIELHLSFNEIDTIEDGAFNLPKLEKMELSHNKLQTLTDYVFLGCPSLKILHLDTNKFTQIGKSIDYIPELSTLSFDNEGVKISDFDFYAIARKPHLEEFLAKSVGLVLDDPIAAANDSYTAEELDISGNDLSYPDILHRLRNFRSLTNLNIGKNNFTTIDDVENILVMFPKLRILDIRHTPRHDEVFQRLQSTFGDNIDIVDSAIHFKANYT